MILVRNISILCIFLLLNGSVILGNNPNKCTSAIVFNNHVAVNRDALIRKQQLETEIQQWILDNGNNRLNSSAAVVTIPIVVHVVYNTPSQNISDAQILTQITVLNKDFRNLNADKLASTHPYFNLTGDANIEFCLAKFDPNGNVTTGITRTSTTLTDFDGNPSVPSDEKVKFNSKGGIDNWDPSKYLNIWICKLNSGTLGYAQFPSEFGTSAETDGVVIDYRYFGTIGTVSAPFDLGRTTTHEIGHWLNLEHIWGDESACANDDNVSDTPLQGAENFNCPSFPSISCSNGPNGDLFMDFMDYTDDGCMSLFSKGQVARMNATLNVARSAIKSANKCSGPTSGVVQQKLEQIRVYPNPVQNYLTIEGLPQTKSRLYSIVIYNILGEKVYVNTLETTTAQLEMLGFKTGTYVLNIYNEEFSYTQKLTVVK
jgi:hypothetical protein